MEYKSALSLEFWDGAHIKVHWIGRRCLASCMGSFTPWPSCCHGRWTLQCVWCLLDKIVGQVRRYALEHSSDARVGQDKTRCVDRFAQVFVSMDQGVWRTKASWHAQITSPSFLSLGLARTEWSLERSHFAAYGRMVGVCLVPSGWFDGQTVACIIRCNMRFIDSNV